MRAVPIILVVDDNEDDRLFVRNALRTVHPDCDVRLATNGVEALSYLEQTSNGDQPRPDLMLLDLKMPLKDGFEVLACTQQQPKWRVTPTIVLSSSALPEDVRRCYELGATGFVVKPVAFPDLLRLCTAILNYWSAILQPDIPHRGGLPVHWERPLRQE